MFIFKILLRKMNERTQNIFNSGQNILKEQHQPRFVPLPKICRQNYDTDRTIHTRA